MPLVTPAYIRSHYTKGDSSDDTHLSEFIKLAQGEVEAIIGQPLIQRAVLFPFIGGKASIPIPYTLRALLVSVEQQSDIGGSWSAVTGPSIYDGRIENANGFYAGVRYRASINVGLRPAADPSDLSEDFGTGEYDNILLVLCEMATLRFIESPYSNAGHKRFALNSMSVALQGMKTESYSFKDMTSRWKSMLGRYGRRLRF